MYRIVEEKDIRTYNIDRERNKRVHGSQFFFFNKYKLVIGFD